MSVVKIKNLMYNYFISSEAYNDGEQDDGDGDEDGGVSKEDETVKASKIGGSQVDIENLVDNS